MKQKVEKVSVAICVRSNLRLLALLWLRLPQSFRGTRPHTYPDTISRDTGFAVQELGAAMADRTRCKDVAYWIWMTVEGL